MEIEQELNKLDEVYKNKIDSLQKLRNREVAELQRNADRKFNDRVVKYDEEIAQLLHTHAN